MHMNVSDSWLRRLTRGLWEMRMWPHRCRDKHTQLPRTTWLGISERRCTSIDVELGHTHRVVWRFERMPTAGASTDTAVAKCSEGGVHDAAEERHNKSGTRARTRSRPRRRRDPRKVFGWRCFCGSAEATHAPLSIPRRSLGHRSKRVLAPGRAPLPVARRQVDLQHV